MGALHPPRGPEAPSEHSPRQGERSTYEPVPDDAAPYPTTRGSDEARATASSKTARALADSPARTLLLHGAVVGGFLLISVLMWWHVWVTGHPTSTLTCQCGDPSEEIWYLAWTPWAIAHLHNPFLSNAIFAGQGGANMLVNTSWIAFAALFAPITWIFGPVATFNVAVTLAPVVSGWCFFLAARKVTSFVPGQFAAAALYGFSPVLVTSDPVGHFFLSWEFFPPLVFLCLYDLFVSRRHRPVFVGLALAALVVVQFFSGTELLAMTVVVGTFAVVCAVLVAPKRAWARKKHMLMGLATAAVVTVAALAYPTWFALEGPRRVVGLAWPDTPGFGAQLSSIVSAGSGVNHPSALVELSGYYGPGGPVATYLGIALLVFLGLSVLVWYRSRLAWVVFAAGVCAWSLSLGPYLVPRRASTNGIWLPFHAIWRLPLLGQIIPVRFAVLTVFAAAMLLAISADGWWRRGRRRLARRRHESSAGTRRGALLVWGTAVGAMCAASLVPIALTYSLPFTVHDEPIPSWFTEVAPHLSSSSVLLTFPYPYSGLPQAMGWQADDALHFRITSGYAIVPGRDGRHSAAISVFGGSEAVLDDLSFGLSGPLPVPTPRTVSSMRRTLARRGVTVVVVTQVGRDPVYAAGYLTEVLGRAPRLQDGAWVWYGLGRAPPLVLPASTLSACVASAPAALSLKVPHCVLTAATGTG